MKQQTANDVIIKKTGKMTEEEWQAAERAQTAPQTEISDNLLTEEEIAEFKRELKKL